MEREYILSEARRLVRLNAGLTDVTEIEAKVVEFESCISIRVYYKNPYPRLANVVPGATGERPVERLVADSMYSDVRIGVLVVLGENLVLLGEVDLNGEAAALSSRRHAPEAAARAARSNPTHNKSLVVHAEHAQWPIPEEF